VSYCLSSFSAVASRVGESWHSSFEEKVIHPKLFYLELNVDGAVPVSEALMWL
jgi:hypothetical protein